MWRPPPSPPYRLSFVLAYLCILDDYEFPDHLVKDRRWKDRAVATKIDTDAASSIDLTTVFDFFQKLGSAFNLTPVTERQLEEAIVSEVRYGFV